MYRTTKNESRRHTSLALAAALACVLAGSAFAQDQGKPSPGNGSSEKAQGGPADPKILKTQQIPGMPLGPRAAAATSGVVELASTTLHTSEARDLSIHFSTECFVYTQDGNSATQGDSTTQAGVTAWVEVDGQPVPVVTSPKPDDGKIGICSRQQTLSSTLSDDEVLNLAVLAQAAHGFNWTDLNVGEGDHTVKVMATLDASANGTGAGNAAAVIGKRTLQVAAVHADTPSSKVVTPQNPPKS